MRSLISNACPAPARIFAARFPFPRASNTWSAPTTTPSTAASRAARTLTWSFPASRIRPSRPRANTFCPASCSTRPTSSPGAPGAHAARSRTRVRPHPGKYLSGRTLSRTVVFPASRSRLGHLPHAHQESLSLRLGYASRRRHHGRAGPPRESGHPQGLEAGNKLTMPMGQNVVIVGGGHNALVAAFYLAKGGFKPLVLERREVIGGAAVTEEFHPGFRAPALAHTVGPLRADVAGDMQLEKSGLELIRTAPRVFAPAPDGRALLFYDDAAKTAEGIAKFSAADARKYLEFTSVLRRISEVFAQVVSMTPPSIDHPSPDALWNLLKVGRGFRGLGKKEMFRLLRWGPMAVADLVAEFFDTELLRAAIAARGIFGTAMGPWSAGTSAVL